MNQEQALRERARIRKARIYIRLVGLALIIAYAWYKGGAGFFPLLGK